jgi:hypothetical protein
MAAMAFSGEGSFLSPPSFGVSACLSGEQQAPRHPSLSFFMSVAFRLRVSPLQSLRGKRAFFVSTIPTPPCAAAVAPGASFEYSDGGWNAEALIDAGVLTPDFEFGEVIGEQL